MDPKLFEKPELGIDQEPVRKNLTYWQDAWRRLKKHKPAILGLIGIIIILLFGFVAPFFFPVSYSDQNNDFSYTPPRLQLYQLDEDFYVFLTGDYKLLEVSQRGELLRRLERVEEDAINRIYTYSHEGGNILLDFSNRVKKQTQEVPYDFKFTYQGRVVTEVGRRVSNKTFPFGSDYVGRNILIRLMYGARITLFVALVSTLVNFFIGVIYGAIAGYEGGRVDNVMMRIVDILTAIPLILIVILIQVIIDDRGLFTMIFSLSSVFWVGMARLVRGQILSIKSLEFVLAAQALGVSRFGIIKRHLIPNAIGPIIVSMTLFIPTAVFVESFISFIGLGISAPAASWGTLASDALNSLLTYPYQLLYPISAIAITMLAFNLLGDGLRDALDPRLRKE